MTFQIRDVDFVAYDERGQVLLLVEVKGKGSHDTSELWAARFRRNILAHGRLPAAPFFLIATPERMYFWRQRDSGPEEGLPQFTLDATNELGPYFEKFRQRPEKARGEVLELIVLAWLNDIAETGQLRAKEDPALQWLSESGLLQALGKAHIELSAVQ
jgi:hypothetical protein